MSSMSETIPAARSDGRVGPRRGAGSVPAKRETAASPTYSATTRRGADRPNNEDAFLAGGGEGGNLFAVADGMGGHEAGEVASSVAVEVLDGLGSSGSLAGAVRRADRLISACRDDGEFAGMGTTIVALRLGVVEGSGPAAEVVHVGDSRAYLLRGGRLRKLTEDHSLAAELARGGTITPERAAAHPGRHALTRALGTGTAGVERGVFDARAGDRFVLCSDGLSGVVGESEMLAVLGRVGEPEGAALALVAAATKAGAPDDATAVVVDVGPSRPARRAVTSPEEDGPVGPRPRAGSVAFRRFGRASRFLLALRGCLLPEPADRFGMVRLFAGDRRRDDGEDRA